MTSNAAGVPLEVHVKLEAFKRWTPEKLGRSITMPCRLRPGKPTSCPSKRLAPIEAVAGPVVSSLRVDPEALKATKPGFTRVADKPRSEQREQADGNHLAFGESAIVHMPASSRRDRVEHAAVVGDQKHCALE